MPTTVEAEIQILSEAEFHEIAEKIIGTSFQIHNTLGRLLDESIFKASLARRCEAVGIGPVQREIRIRVSHGNYAKDYLIDLLIACGVIVEAKAVDKLLPVHNAQTLNYLYLTGVYHGLLLNFRTAKVEKRFVSTSFDLEQRRRVNLVENEWYAVNSESQFLKSCIMDLLLDWGGLLNVSLYRDALIHLMGGESQSLVRIPIYDESVELGSQEVFLIGNDTIVAITAQRGDIEPMRLHLEHFLHHTRMRYLQWVNMDLLSIRMMTFANE